MKLPYARSGSAPGAVVLVHGWFAAGPVWEAVRAGLDASERSVIVPELRGAGRAEAFRGPYDAATTAADLGETLDAAGIDSAVLVAHSMSARAALLLAAREPARVASVVAVAPVPPQGLDFDERARQLYRAALADDEALASLIGVLSGRRYPRAWARAEAGLARRAMSGDAARGYLHDFVENDVSAGVEGLSVPVLALCGDADPAMTPAFVGEALAPLCPRLSVRTLPGCTHYPMREAPLPLAAAVNVWCTDGDRPGGSPLSRERGRP